VFVSDETAANKNTNLSFSWHIVSITFIWEVSHINAVTVTQYFSPSFEKNAAKELIEILPFFWELRPPPKARVTVKEFL
jgi:hypothetical protein